MNGSSYDFYNQSHCKEQSPLHSLDRDLSQDSSLISPYMHACALQAPAACFISLYVFLLAKIWAQPRVQDDFVQGMTMPACQTGGWN